jgi:tRNA-modifying protein YgfZ
MNSVAELPDRAVIAVEGEDRVEFLQGLVSNDVALAGPERCVWAALLTPQGKWLADFFVFSTGERLLLDCETSQVAMLVQRLSRYRLRMKVKLEALPDWSVSVSWPGNAPGAGVAAPDPRIEGFCWRRLAPEPPAANASAADWDLYRLEAGVPDGAKDMETDRSVLLEGGFDDLNGVSWTKGCYMGQELTARTKYRGLIKRRLVPVSIHGAVPAPGTPIMQNGLEVGTMRSGRDEVGLALLRLSALRGELLCDGSVLTPRIREWMRLPETVSAEASDGL